MHEPFRLRDDGIEVVVRLTPRSSVDALEGVAQAADGRAYLNARVRAVPEKGAANAALEKLLAKALGAPVSTVSVVAGNTSRLKTVRVRGDAALLAAAVARLETCQGASARAFSAKV